MSGTPTSFSTSDVQTRKLWSDRMLYDSISDETLVGQMIGDGSLSRKDDLSATGTGGRGDEIKYHFLNRLNNKGLVGMQTSIGQEQSQTYYQDVILVNQVRNVTKNPNTGSIDQQRVTFDLQEDAYEVLRDWFIERMTVSAINQLTGNDALSITWDGQTYTGDERLVLTGLNSAKTPSSTRIIRPNSLATDEAVNADSTAKMTFSIIDSMIDNARKERPYIMPFDGSIKFKLYVHIDTFRQLWQDTTSPFQYRDFVYNKLAGGAADAQLEGEYIDYNMTRIIATDKMPYGVNSSTKAELLNTRRSVLVGKYAGCVAFGQGYNGGGQNTTAGFRFEEDYEDVKLFKLTSIVGVYGVVKTQFNNIDHGSIVTTTYVD